MKLSIVFLLFILLGFTGCSATTSQINFTKNTDKKNFFEQFPGAYITSNQNGEYDIILVDDTLRSSRKQTGKRPLTSISQPPLQQGLHIHVFWKPNHSGLAREACITNAILHWYVFGTGETGHQDMVHYEGAAFVTLNSGKDRSQIHIGNGSIAVRKIQGDFRDPVGPSQISGNINAIHNDSKVKDLLIDFQSRASGTAAIPTGNAVVDESPIIGK